jgi:predicted GNAT family acetyltransferase
MDGDELRVEHNEAAQRFEATVEGRLAVAEYERAGDAIVFTHTGVPAELRGRGIASELARVALETARTRQLTVVPSCPFFAGYIRRHPEYADLVSPAHGC